MPRLKGTSFHTIDEHFMADMQRGTAISLMMPGRNALVASPHGTRKTDTIRFVRASPSAQKGGQRSAVAAHFAAAARDLIQVRVKRDSLEQKELSDSFCVAGQFGPAVLLALVTGAHSARARRRESAAARAQQHCGRRCERE